MAQDPKKKRRLSPRDLELNDHDLMEKIVGKRVMRAVDKELAEAQGVAGEEDEPSMPTR